MVKDKDDKDKERPIPKDPPLRPEEEIEPIHALGITLALREVTRRLESVEEKIDKDSGPLPAKSHIILEACKVIFGGWTVLGFVFLLLFYTPLQGALTAISRRVEAANEFGVLGLSFKGTIQKVAERSGEAALSETIPSLSPDAIEYLLKAPESFRPLVSFVPSHGEWAKVAFPSNRFVLAISELQALGLVTIKNEGLAGNGNKGFTGSDMRKWIDDFRRSHPGKEEAPLFDGMVTWSLDKPIPSSTAMNFGWQLTSQGVQAADIILKSIAAELSPAALESPR